MEQQSPSLKAMIESLLFVSEKPIHTKRLSELTKCDPSAVSKAIEDLTAEYTDPSHPRGMTLITQGEEVQMLSNHLYAPIIERLLAREAQTQLSDASIETLAVIAYKGPLSKAAIEQVRGVNSNQILRTLLSRGLVQKTPIKDGNDLYQVSAQLLHTLGKQRAEDLPEYERFHASSVAS